MGLRRLSSHGGSTQTKLQLLDPRKTVTVLPRKNKRHKTVMVLQGALQGEQEEQALPMVLPKKNQLSVPQNVPARCGTPITPLISMVCVVYA